MKIKFHSAFPCNSFLSSSVFLHYNNLPFCSSDSPFKPLYLPLSWLLSVSVFWYLQNYPLSNCRPSSQLEPVSLCSVSLTHRISTHTLTDILTHTHRHIHVHISRPFTPLSGTVHYGLVLKILSPMLSHPLGLVSTLFPASHPWYRGVHLNVIFLLPFPFL